LLKIATAKDIRGMIPKSNGSPNWKIVIKLAIMIKGLE
jgi:hypothetical protein